MNSDLFNGHPVSNGGNLMSSVFHFFFTILPFCLQCSGRNALWFLCILIFVLPFCPFIPRVCHLFSFCFGAVFVFVLVCFSFIFVAFSPCFGLSQTLCSLRFRSSHRSHFFHPNYLSKFLVFKTPEKVNCCCKFVVINPLDWLFDFLKVDFLPPRFVGEFLTFSLFLF